MKKTLLTMSILVSVIASAQTPSPDWVTVQNTSFTLATSGVRFMDAVDANVLWASNYDGSAPSRNYNAFTRTINGGTSFNSGNVFADTNTYVISSIEGVDANTAFVTAYYNSSSDLGVIYKTSNGGATWANCATAGMFSTSGSSFANFTCFTSSLTGVSCGDPVGGVFEIYRTTDGGSTWAAVTATNIPNPASDFGLNDCYTKFGNNIWFGTDGGRVFHSSDAGLTWTVGTTTASNGITKLAFRDAMNGLAYGYTTTAASSFSVYKTTDGGANWTVISPVPANIGRKGLCAIPGTNKYASCGSATTNTVLAYSTDDGATWTDWGSVGIQYLDIDFVNANTGWAGAFQSSGNGGMYKYVSSSTDIKVMSDLSNKINAFPNPTNGLLNVAVALQNKENLSISVSNALGQVIMSNNYSSISNETLQLNLSNQNNGIYFVTVSNGTEKTIKRVVLNK